MNPNRQYNKQRQGYNNFKQHPSYNNNCQETSSKTTLTNHTNNQKISLKHQKTSIINSHQNGKVGEQTVNHKTVVGNNIDCSNNNQSHYVSQTSSILNMNNNGLKSPQSKNTSYVYVAPKQHQTYTKQLNNNAQIHQKYFNKDPMLKSVGITTTLKHQTYQRQNKNQNMQNSLPPNLSKPYVENKHNLNPNSALNNYIIKTPSHSPITKNSEKQVNSSFNNNNNKPSMTGRFQQGNKNHFKKYSDNQLENRYIYTYVRPQMIEQKLIQQNEQRQTMLSPGINKQKQKQITKLRPTQPQNNSEFCFNPNTKLDKRYGNDKIYPNGSIQLKYIKAGTILMNQAKKSTQIKSGKYVKLEDKQKTKQQTKQQHNNLNLYNQQSLNLNQRKCHKPMSSFDRQKPQNFINYYDQSQTETKNESSLTNTDVSNLQKSINARNNQKNGVRSTLTTNTAQTYKQSETIFDKQSFKGENQSAKIYYQNSNSGQAKYHYYHTYNQRPYQSQLQKQKSFQNTQLSINVKSPEPKIANPGENKIVTAFSSNQKNIIINKNYFFGSNQKDRPIQQNNRPKRSIKKMLNQPHSRPQQLSEVLISLKYSDLSKNIDSQKSSFIQDSEAKVFDFGHSRLGRFFCSTFKININKQGCDCQPKCSWMDRWIAQTQKQQYKKNSLLKNNFVAKVKKLGLVQNLFDFSDEISTSHNFNNNNLNKQNNQSIKPDRSTSTLITCNNPKSSSKQNDSQTLKQIQKDIPRTYSDHPTFQNLRYQQLLKQLLINFYTLDKQFGYFQGLNIIAASLVYHAKNSYESLKIMDFIINILNYRCIFQNDMKQCKVLALKTSNLVKNYCFDMYNYVVIENQIQLDMFILGWYFSMLGSFVPLQKMHLVVNKFIKRGFLGLAQIIVTYFICIKQTLMEKQDQNEIMQQLSMQNMIKRSKNIDWQQLVSASCQLNLTKF